MTPERWQQVKGVLEQVLEISPPQRARFLDQACEGDESLRLEVESLLEDENAGPEGFLEAPLWTSAVFESALSDSWVGRRIGAYEVGALIGEGGMGSVYRGIRADQQYEKQVAIKVVRQGLGTAFALAQFRAERQILANLDHPHIARLLDGGTTDVGLPYLVMELVDGEPIDQYCNARKLSIEERLRLFLRVCSGVQYAHQHLVIHRDLKPGNILVTPDGTPKLLDFGIAKILDPGSTPNTNEPTMNAMRMLTPEYASPEQVRGEVVTTASDVYSLGVVLFRLLTGQHPFESQTRSPDEILLATRDAEPPKPSTAVRWESAADKAEPSSGRVFQASSEDSPDKLSNRLRGDLDNIVLMALKKEPERRYASAEHFAEDIRRHLESLPVKARPDTFRYRASKFIGRHKTGVLVASCVAALLVVLMVGIVWEAHVARVQRARAERRFQDVRSLANSLIFDVHDSIQDLPGSTVARKLIVDKALQYLDSLQEESQGDASLQRELSEAYKRIGDVQGNEFSANLGDTTNALKSYGKALSIREGLWASRKDHDLADALSLAELYRLVSQTQLFAGEVTTALDSSKKAVALIEPLMASHANDPTVLLETLVDYQSVANILGGDQSLSNLGDNEGALDYRRKQLGAAERLVAMNPTDERSRGNYAIALTTMGDQLWQGGQGAASLQYYIQARPIFADIAFRSSRGPRGRYLLGLLFERITVVQLAKGNMAEALTSAHEAMKLSKGLSEADPRNVQSGSTLALDYRLIADLESRVGHPKQAWDDMGKANALMHKIVILSPKDTEVMGSQADLHTTTGDIASRSGDFHRARKEYQEAIAVLTSVASQNSKNAGAGLHLAANYNCLGRTEQKLRNSDSAASAHRKALELTEAADKSGHPNVQTLYTRADAYVGLGDVEASLAASSRIDRAIRAQHLRQAISFYKESADIWSRIKEPGIVSPDAFDCIAPAAVNRRLNQCEESLRTLTSSA